MKNYANFLSSLNYIQDEEILENYEVDIDDEVLDLEYNELLGDFLEKKNDLDFFHYMLY